MLLQKAEDDNKRLEAEKLAQDEELRRLRSSQVKNEAMQRQRLLQTHARIQRERYIRSETARRERERKAKIALADAEAERMSALTDSRRGDRRKDYDHDYQTQAEKWAYEKERKAREELDQINDERRVAQEAALLEREHHMLQEVALLENGSGQWDSVRMMSPSGMIPPLPFQDVADSPFDMDYMLSLGVAGDNSNPIQRQVGVQPLPGRSNTGLSNINHWLQTFVGFPSETAEKCAVALHQHGFESPEDLISLSDAEASTLNATGLLHAHVLKIRRAISGNDPKHGHHDELMERAERSKPDTAPSNYAEGSLSLEREAAAALRAMDKTRNGVVTCSDFLQSLNDSHSSLTKLVTEVHGKSSGKLETRLTQRDYDFFVQSVDVTGSGSFTVTQFFAHIFKVASKEAFKSFDQRKTGFLSVVDVGNNFSKARSFICLPVRMACAQTLGKTERALVIPQDLISWLKIIDKNQDLKVTVAEITDHVLDALSDENGFHREYSTPSSTQSVHLARDSRLYYQVSAAFDYCDLNNDDSISVQEMTRTLDSTVDSATTDLLRHACAIQLKRPEESLRHDDYFKFFSLIDKNNNGRINRDEFIAFMLQLFGDECFDQATSSKVVHPRDYHEHHFHPQTEVERHEQPYSMHRVNYGRAESKDARAGSIEQRKKVARPGAVRSDPNKFAKGTS